MRLRYRLLKDTPELRAGAIVEEACDDGTQDFVGISPELEFDVDVEDGVSYSRKVVMTQPEWFEKVEPLWLPARLAEKVKAFFETL